MNRRNRMLLAVMALLVAVHGVPGQADRGQPKKGDDVFTSAAEAGPDFQVQGEYEGEVTGKGKYGAQAVALGDGKFDVYFLAGGLPGAGWDKETRVKVPAVTAEGKTSLAGKEFTGEIADGHIRGKTASGESFALKRVERTSPTLGMKPPEGAIVLFDGTSAEEWQGGKVVEDNLLFCGTRSKKAFGVGTLHIEFRTPFKPKGRGQGRGNSGVYVMGTEVQVLDSFGLNGEKNECGALYNKAKPAVNMCLPPLSWQTYDVVVKPGEKGLVMTVRHNGIVVHEDFPIGGSADRTASINLQNHNNPVVYRNIWFVPAGKTGE